MSADLAVQKALRERLIGAPGVTDLVPASAILDRNQRPAPDPSIILGESQVIQEDADLSRSRSRVIHTIHVWKREPSLQGAKGISGAVAAAFATRRLTLGEGLHAVDCKVSMMRVMRDPDGETSHGVVTLEVLVQEVA